MPINGDKGASKMVQDIDAAWNSNDIEHSTADQLRRYLKITFPLRDLSLQKIIHFKNVGSGWEKCPCFAYPWGYSNIKHNCPGIEEDEFDYITRVMSAYIQMEQVPGVSESCSNKGNYTWHDVTEHYIASQKSPFFCQYLQGWTDPQGISPIRIPERTAVFDALKWWLLAAICEGTTDENPFISQSEIELSLLDQQGSNEIKDCPLWEIIVKSDDLVMHPDSHMGKNAFYTIRYCYGHRLGEVYSYVVDPEYRRAFLATEKKTGIDTRVIMECIRRAWITHCEKQRKSFGMEIEALSTLLLFIDGNDRAALKPDQLEHALLDLLMREKIITKIYSGDYILSRGVSIGATQKRLENLKRACSQEDDQWLQNPISLQQAQKDSIKPQKERETEKIPDEEQSIGFQEPQTGKRYCSEGMNKIQQSLLTAFSIPICDQSIDAEYLSRLESHLKEIFAEFKIDCGIDKENFDTNGPRTIRANIKPGKGITIASIQKKSRDIANRLYGASELFDFKNEDEVPTDVYIENVSAKGMVGIHIPRKDYCRVGIRGLLETLPGRSQLEIPIGLNTTGNAKYSDLLSMPHLLIAGHTGSGKSVFLNSFIISILFQNSPADLKLQLIDPKGGLEFGAYENVPYLYGDLVESAERAVGLLNGIILEMESRFKLFKQCKVKLLSDYNKLEGIDKKPFIVIIIDEFGDLVGMPKGKDVKDALLHLAQKGRAAGIHLVIATQKPTAKVIDDIKANLPSRLAFRVATQSDSRIILDENGAENLYGNGDCFLKESEVPELRRFQAAYVSDDEIERFVKMLRDHWEAETSR